MKKILIVDDEQDIVESLKFNQNYDKTVPRNLDVTLYGEL